MAEMDMLAMMAQIMSCKTTMMTQMQTIALECPFLAPMVNDMTQGMNPDDFTLPPNDFTLPPFDGTIDATGDPNLFGRRLLASQRKLLSPFTQSPAYPEVSSSSSDFPFDAQLMTDLCVTQPACLGKYIGAMESTMTCISSLNIPGMEADTMEMDIPDVGTICATNPLTGEFCAVVLAEMESAQQNMAITGAIPDSIADSVCPLVVKAGCCLPLQFEMDADALSGKPLLESMCGFTFGAKCADSTVVVPVDFALPVPLPQDAVGLAGIQLDILKDLADSLGVSPDSIAITLDDDGNGDIKVTFKLANADAATLSGLTTTLQGATWTNTANTAGKPTIDTSAATVEQGEPSTVQQAAKPTVIAPPTTIGAGSVVQVSSGILALGFALTL